MNLLNNIKYKIHAFRMKRKYPDYKDDCYNCDNLKFIWGIKSWDDLSRSDANLWTMNDLDITYDRNTGEYLLGIETIYHFEDGYDGEVKYLEYLVDKFAEFVYSGEHKPLDKSVCLVDIESQNPWRSKTIFELYLRFRVFVEGYKTIYETAYPYKHVWADENIRIVTRK